MGPEIEDHERELLARGRSDAPAMGLYLAARKYFPDLVLSSTARRTVETAEAVIEKLPRKQHVEYTDRLYLAEDMPSLIGWGRRDPIIPVRHAGNAHRGMPGSRLEVFDSAGHFPQLDEPDRFADTLAEFVETTEPARADTDQMRARMTQ